MLLDLPAYDHSADSRLEVRSFLLFFGKALIFNASFSLVYVRGEEVFTEQAVLKENSEALVRPCGLDWSPVVTQRGLCRPLEPMLPRGRELSFLCT